LQLRLFSTQNIIRLYSSQVTICVYVSARSLVNVVADTARTTGRDGGVAIIYRVCVPLISTSGPVVIMNIYWSRIVGCR